MMYRQTGEFTVQPHHKEGEGAKRDPATSQESYRRTGGADNMLQSPEEFGQHSHRNPGAQPLSKADRDDRPSSQRIIRDMWGSHERLHPANRDVRASSHDRLHPANRESRASSHDRLYPDNRDMQASSQERLHPENRDRRTSSNEKLYSDSRAMRASSHERLYPDNRDMRALSHERHQENRDMRASSHERLYPYSRDIRVSSHERLHPNNRDMRVSSHERLYTGNRDMGGSHERLYQDSKGTKASSHDRLYPDSKGMSALRHDRLYPENRDMRASSHERLRTDTRHLRGSHDRLPTTVSLRPDYQHMQVVFHIVVAPDFKMKPADEVMLVLKSSGEGSPMTKEGSLLKNHQVMQLELNFTNTQLTEGVEYHYEVQNAKHVTHEVLPEDDEGTATFRLLRLADDFTLEQGMYHRYDGIMHKKGKKKFETKDGFQKRLHEETQAVITYTLPTWSGGMLHNPEMFLDEVAHCASSFHSNFIKQQTEAVPFGQYLQAYLGDITDGIHMSLCHSLDISHSTSGVMNPTTLQSMAETEAVKVSRVITAMVVVYLVVQYNVSIKEKWHILCSALLCIQDRTDSCPERTILRKYFPAKSKTLHAVLRQFIRLLCNRELVEPHWVLILPLYQALSDSHSLDGSTDDFADPTWWGLHELKNEIKEFAHRCHPTESQYKEYESCFAPLIEAQNSRRLGRTLLALLPVGILSKRSDCYQLSMILRRLTFQVEVLWQEKDIQTLLNIVHVVHARVKETTLSRDLNRLAVVLEEIQEIAAVSVRLLRSLCHVTDSIEDYEIIDCSTSVTDACIKLITRALSAVSNSPHMNRATHKLISSHDDRLKKTFSDLGVTISSWIARVTPRQQITTQTHQKLELKVLSQFLSRDFGSRSVNDLWAQSLLENAVLFYTKHGAAEKISYFIHYDFSQHHKSLQSLFRQLAEDGVDQLAASQGDVPHLFKTYDTMDKMSKALILLSRYISQVLTREGAESLTQPENFLRWPPFHAYIQFLIDKVDMSHQVCKPIVDIMELGLGKLKKTISGLQDATIRVSSLQILLENRNFLVKAAVYCGIGALGNLLTVWQQQLTEFQELTEVAKIMVELFENTSKPVCVVRLDVDIKEAEDNPVIIKITHPLESKEQAFHTQNIYDHPTRAALEKMKTITIYKPCLALLKIVWGEIFEELQRETSHLESLSLLLDSIWSQAKINLQNLYGDLSTGEISFGRVKIVFEEYQGRYDEMRSLLLAFSKAQSKSSSVKWVDIRIKQIQQCHLLEQCASSANVIIQCRDVFSLRGDFNAVLELQKTSDFDRLKLTAVTDSMVRACEALHGMGKQEQECLSVYTQCKFLVDWIKTRFKDQREINAFVDLAMIKCESQSSLQVAFLGCFHSAVMGYRTLLLDLKPEMGFTEFMELCKPVFNALQAHSELPHDLLKTMRNMAWLQAILDGEDNLNPVDQAIKINNTGVYTVGLSNTHPTYIPKKVDEIIQHRGKHGEGKTMCLQELKDLQSKLLLVIGKDSKDKAEADRYRATLDAVIALGCVYLKTLQAGSVLFRKGAWFIKICCKPTDAINVQILTSDTTFTSYNAPSFNVVAAVEDTTHFLEQCLHVWNQYVEGTRQSYPILNHFSSQQLLLLLNWKPSLCISDEEGDFVGKVKAAGFPEDVALMALDHFGVIQEHNMHAVLAWCSSYVRGTNTRPVRAGSVDSYDPVYHLLQFVLPQLDLDHNLWRNILMKFKLIVQNATMKTARESSQKLISALRLKGYGQKLAEEAIQLNIRDEDVVSWCENHLRKQIVHQNTTDISQENRVIQEKMKNSWLFQLESMDSCDKGSLSLKQLGQLLESINQQELRILSRELSHPLVKGTPNLVVCPRVDLLKTVLSLYMGSDGEDSLPTGDEVLLCCKETTSEEVELLLRRAVTDRTNKLYCLADVSNLSYEAQQQFEAALEKYFRNAHGYQLVVLCCQESEHKSLVATVLDEYRRCYKPTYLLRDYRGSLLRHFTLVEPRNKSVHHEQDWKHLIHANTLLVKSYRAGNGKSHKVKKILMLFQSESTSMKYVRVTLHRRTVDNNLVVRELMSCYSQRPMFIHLNIAHEVEEGVGQLLFNLLVLGGLTYEDGMRWQRRRQDIYVIENTIRRSHTHQQQNEGGRFMHEMLELVPSVTCWGPKNSLLVYSSNKYELRTLYGADCEDNVSDQYMDEEMFLQNNLQRVFLYINSLEGTTHNKSSKKDFITLMLRHCGTVDPTWAEMSNFLSFLSTQLIDMDSSVFCRAELNDLPGFRTFVVKFMLHMSRDFATRSLEISEQSPISAIPNQSTESANPGQYLIKRRWEKSFHPYLFFNADPKTGERHSMTFLGFHVNLVSGDIIDPDTLEILERGVMMAPLSEGLLRNRVQININFSQYTRWDWIKCLCLVMGISDVRDPDPTYELTADNVKKILAVYMRFRCGIPVIVMGETGCGKTRLIRFMCALQMPQEDITNLFLMKVHGGTTEGDISDKVRKASAAAKENTAKYPLMDTVLFFDEANTTDAIGHLKEIVCDRHLAGKPLSDHGSLKFVLACNPYRKHSEAVITKLEHAGLGYHVRAEETKDRLGHIPMRQLVYRVHPLPQSLHCLVWDFGQLNSSVENTYIQQMVIKKLPARLQLYPRAISNVLTASQEFMKRQQDDCSFVSLRDVDRVLEVMNWFLDHGEVLFPMMTEKNRKMHPLKLRDTIIDLQPCMRALILAIGVCYHACLERRDEFRKHIAPHFTSPLEVISPDRIIQQINLCQDVFLDHLSLTSDIARNQALRENVFMMVVCIDLRIPLFLVGKPGSSKSLAKSIVAEAMQGPSSASLLFRRFKLVQMISFQCSPLSTPEGIISTFDQGARLQQNKSLGHYVSVVVLDEIGLAEDSAKMPLKTLHPLLEDGCLGDEKPAPHKKVATVAISNWALDPAKMNRGIHVQRLKPGLQELEDTARGICSSMLSPVLDKLMKPLASGYLELYEQTLTHNREFFGLRDFYSLVKMIASSCERNNRGKPSWLHIKHSILRNFGGLDHIDPVAIFEKHIQANTRSSYNTSEKRNVGDPDCSPATLIGHSIRGDGFKFETRYTMFLTENYAALSILQQKFLDKENTVIIFGSSFPRDREYKQVCHNINRIKLCMEAGRTLVLLNLEDLYESLYDALNQYYVYLGDERFVDLGLGTQRVKCQVHKTFRLVLVAEKSTVYERFPIPLINRLEKHYLAVTTVLSPDQLNVVDKLKTWAKQFTTVQGALPGRQWKISDTIIGYTDDTVSAITMMLSEELNWQDGHAEKSEEVLQAGKNVLLQCATPDAVMRVRLTPLAPQEVKLYDSYFNKQHHGCLQELLLHLFSSGMKTIFLQVTTHSQLLSGNELQSVSRNLQKVHGHVGSVSTLMLNAFNTEQQFHNEIQQTFSMKRERDHVLLIQCDWSLQNESLVACACNIISQEYNNSVKSGVNAETHVVMIIRAPRFTTPSTIILQDVGWQTYYLDDLRLHRDGLPPLVDMKNTPLSAIYGAALENESQTQAEPGPARVCLDVERMLRACVHSSVVMVMDPSSQPQCKLRRIDTVLSLLAGQGQGNDRFVRILHRRIHSLLKDKEESAMIGNMATNWISSDAASLPTVTKAGTFRRAIWKCIESKVSPILAGIVAYVDTNNNLDTLAATQPDDWRHSFWLQMFNQMDITQLLYRDLQSLTKNSTLNEFLVSTPGYSGAAFPSWFPFSWVIFDRIEQILLQTKGAEGVSDLEEVVSRLFSDTRLGCLISQYLQNAPDEMVSAYMHDFIRMVYTAQSENKDLEYSLVEMALRCSVAQHGNGRRMLDNLSMPLPAIHYAYSQIKTRLHHCAQVCQLWPKCPDVLHSIRTRAKAEYLFQNTCEVTLDMQLLYTLLLMFDVEYGIQNEELSNKVEKFSPIIEQLLGGVENDSTPGTASLPHGPVCKAYHFRLKQKWTYITVMNHFWLEVEAPCRAAGHKIQISTISLTQSLQKNCDFKKLPALVAVESFLQENTARLSKTLSRKELAAYEHYKKCLGMFFMWLVSSQCFSGNTLPDKAVIDKLISLATGTATYPSRTHRDREHATYPARQLTISRDPEHADSCDLSPVVRSFLLQILLQCNLDAVRTHLSAYFQQACAQYGPGNSSHVSELCMLFVSCMEDCFLRVLREKKGSVGVAYAKHMLQHHRKNLLTGNLCIAKLEAIAATRVSLEEVAKCIYQKYIQKTQFPSKWSVIELLKEAQNLCRSVSAQDDRAYSQMSVYLISYIQQVYGFNALAEMACIKELNWVVPEELRLYLLNLKPDIFKILGGSYRQIRTVVFGALVGHPLQEAFMKCEGTAAEKERNLLLAVLRLKDDILRGKEQHKLLIHEFCMQQITRNVPVTLILSNQFGQKCPQLTFRKGQSSLGQKLVELLIHWSIVMGHVSPRTLPQPFLYLATDPGCMRAAYFPTMPESDLKEVIAATRVAHASTTAWTCPNGHPYVVGNCGKPTEKRKCPACNAEIGASSYNNVVTGNKQIHEFPETARLYILGKASGQSSVVEPVRQLTSLSVCVMRCLLHMSLILGANTKPEEIVRLITPTVLLQDVAAFLWEHLLLDLVMIQKTLSLNVDDSFVLLHTIVNSILMLPNSKPQQDVVLYLTSEASRKTWEAEFSRTYLPDMEKIRHIIDRANQSIMESDTGGHAGDLIRILYGTKDLESLDLDCIEQSACLWRYRPHITSGHLKQAVQVQTILIKRETSPKYPVLQLLLTEEERLKALRYLPAIIRLHKLLTQRLHRNIDRSEASKVSMGDFIHNEIQDHLKEDVRQMVKSFSKAWTMVKSDLKKFVVGGATVAARYLDGEVHQSTSLSMFLPSLHGQGLCSTALVLYLVQLHNYFLEDYHRIIRKTLNTEIDIQEVTRAHLVTFDLESDVMPLVMANSKYNMEPGQSLSIQYDFGGLEAALAERFVKGRTRLSSEIPLVVYREDFTNADIFVQLEAKIPQEPLSAALQAQIRSEIPHLTEINDSLSALDIAVGFLVSVGRDPQLSIPGFIQQYLKMSTKGLAEVLHRCMCKHTKSLWLLLTQEKYKTLAQYDQDPFEKLDDKYKTQIPKTLQEKLKSSLQHMNCAAFALQLFEFMILHLAGEQDTNREDYVDDQDFPLGYSLHEFFSDKPEPDIPALIDGRFPADIFLHHSVHVWKMAASII